MEETFLERYDGVFWGRILRDDDYLQPGCFFLDPFKDTFAFRNNPPLKVGFWSATLHPLGNCTTILFSNPNYIITENSANIFSYNYEDNMGTHTATYTVSNDGNTLVFEDENCGPASSLIEFERTETEFNPPCE